MVDDDSRQSDDAAHGSDGTARDPDGTVDGDPDGAGDSDGGVEQSVSASDSTTDATAAPDGERTGGSDPDRGGRPEVVVPMDLYRTVTVFSTLFAIALVVGGMIALDAATARATADAAAVNLPLAFLGVASIVLGAATYAFAARFRAEGMGNPKDTDDEG